MKPFLPPRLVSPALSAVLILALSACSTPASRIQHDPGTFAKLTPAQQALVRQGQIELGMDRATVELALGKPDRTRTRTSTRGSSEVWLYMAHEGSTTGALYYGRGFYAPYGARWWGPGPVYYSDNYETYPRLRVEFRDGRVAGIDQESR